MRRFLFLGLLSLTQFAFATPRIDQLTRFQKFVAAASEKSEAFGGAQQHEFDSPTMGRSSMLRMNFAGGIIWQILVSENRFVFTLMRPNGQLMDPDHEDDRDTANFAMFQPMLEEFGEKIENPPADLFVIDRFSGLKTGIQLAIDSPILETQAWVVLVNKWMTLLKILPDLSGISGCENILIGPAKT